MPGLKAYLHGFGIYNGLNISGYILTNINGDENVIKAYHEYEYPIDLIFSPQMYGLNPNELLFNLKQMTSGTRKIYSSYHNPYVCDFGDPFIKDISSDGRVIIETTGHSYRI